MKDRFIPHLGRVIMYRSNEIMVAVRNCVNDNVMSAAPKEKHDRSEVK